MASKSNYLVNKLIDWFHRGQSFAPPATKYYGLYRATAGQSPRSTAVTSGQTTIPLVHNGRMYKCTTSGTTGASEPTWPLTDGGTVSDGTAVWTEMTPDLKSYSSAVSSVEVTGTNYARVAVTSSTTNFAATNAAGSTTNPSSGTSGQTSNNVAITWPVPGSNWGVIAMAYTMDAVSGGNPLQWSILAEPKTINNSDPAPSYPAAAWVYSEY